MPHAVVSVHIMHFYFSFRLLSMLLVSIPAESDLCWVRRWVCSSKPALSAFGGASEGALGHQGLHLQDLRQGVQDVCANKGAYEESHQNEVKQDTSGCWFITFDTVKWKSFGLKIWLESCSCLRKNSKHRHIFCILYRPRGVWFRIDESFMTKKTFLQNSFRWICSSAEWWN